MTVSWCSKNHGQFSFPWHFRAPADSHQHCVVLLLKGNSWLIVCQRFLSDLDKKMIHAASKLSFSIVSVYLCKYMFPLQRLSFLKNQQYSISNSDHLKWSIFCLKSSINKVSEKKHNFEFLKKVMDSLKLQLMKSVGISYLLTAKE